MTQLCLTLVILLHQPSKCCVTDRHHNTSLGGPLLAAPSEGRFSVTFHLPCLIALGHYSLLLFLLGSSKRQSLGH